MDLGSFRVYDCIVIVVVLFRLAKADLVFPCPDVGEGSEGERALDFTDVIVQNVCAGETLSEVEAVLDLERLAKRPLLGASAHRARAHLKKRIVFYVPRIRVELVGHGVKFTYPFCVARLNGLTANIAGNPLLPQLEVDFGQCVAWNPRVQEWIGNIEHCPLNTSHLVAMITDDLYNEKEINSGQVNFRLLYL